MKIMHIIPNLNIAGAEKMCCSLSIEQAKLGNDVIVISLYSLKTFLSDSLEKSGIKVFFLDKKRGVDLTLVRKIKRILQKEKPDILHTHLYSLKYVYFASKKTKTPIIHTVHNIAVKEVSWLDRILCKHLFKKKKAYPIALSEEIKKTIEITYGITDVPIVKNGIDLSECINKTTYALGNSIHILNVARFSPQKNHLNLIKGFYSFLNKTKLQNVYLDLIGEGETQAECKELVKQLKIEDKVIFHGLIKNVFPYLHNADLFILPSTYEGIPISLIEAMGTSLPIIASNVGGIPNMIADFESGVFCEPTQDSISKAIELVLSNLSLRERIGLNANVTAKNHFSTSSMAANYLRLYEDIFK